MSLEPIFDCASDDKSIVPEPSVIIFPAAMTALLATASMLSWSGCLTIAFTSTLLETAFNAFNDPEVVLIDGTLKDVVTQKYIAATMREQRCNFRKWRSTNICFGLCTVTRVLRMWCTVNGSNAVKCLGTEWRSEEGYVNTVIDS